MTRRKRSDLETASRKRIIDHAVACGIKGVSVYVRRVILDRPELMGQPVYVAGLVSCGDSLREGTPALSEGRACELLLRDVLMLAPVEGCIR